MRSGYLQSETTARVGVDGAHNDHRGPVITKKPTFLICKNVVFFCLFGVHKKTNWKWRTTTPAGPPFEVAVYFPPKAFRSNTSHFFHYTFNIVRYIRAKTRDWADGDTGECVPIHFRQTSQRTQNVRSEWVEGSDTIFFAYPPGFAWCACVCARGVS